MVKGRLAVLVGIVLTTVFVGLEAPLAAAETPQRRTFTFHPVNPDLFAEVGMEQRCDFPVVGAWDVVGTELDFVDQRTGAPTMTLLSFLIDGTLSNPLSGKSVADRGTDRYLISFAADGTVARITEEENVQSSWLRIHAHFVLDPDGNIVVDVGRDDLTYNAHPFSIQPLCEALA